MKPRVRVRVGRLGQEVHVSGRPFNFYAAPRWPHHIWPANLWPVLRLVRHDGSLLELAAYPPCALRVALRESGRLFPVDGCAGEYAGSSEDAGSSKDVGPRDDPRIMSGDEDDGARRVGFWTYLRRWLS